METPFGVELEANFPNKSSFIEADLPPDANWVKVRVRVSRCWSITAFAGSPLDTCDFTQTGNGWVRFPTGHVTLPLAPDKPPADALPWSS